MEWWQATVVHADTNDNIRTFLFMTEPDEDAGMVAEGRLEEGEAIGAVVSIPEPPEGHPMETDLRSPT